MTRPLRLGVLLSGTGRTFLNLLQERDKSGLPIEPRCVISSRDGVKGLEYAAAAGVPSLVLTPPRPRDPEHYGRMIGQALQDHGVDLVVMAGFLQLWRIPDQYVDRVMNIHPSLLPSFGGEGYYGHHVHEAVLAAGVKVSGCTVHFADNAYDQGPIIVQRCVPVGIDDTPDTLADRVFVEECRAYPEAIRLFAENRLRREGRRVAVLPLASSGPSSTP